MRLDPELTRRVLELADKPTSGAVVDEVQSEKAFQADVIRFAKRHGWVRAKEYDEWAEVDATGVCWDENNLQSVRKAG